MHPSLAHPHCCNSCSAWAVAACSCASSAASSDNAATTPLLPPRRFLLAFVFLECLAFLLDRARFFFTVPAALCGDPSCTASAVAVAGAVPLRPAAVVGVRGTAVAGVGSATAVVADVAGAGAAAAMRRPTVAGAASGTARWRRGRRVRSRGAVLRPRCRGAALGCRLVVGAGRKGVLLLLPEAAEAANAADAADAWPRSVDATARGDGARGCRRRAVLGRRVAAVPPRAGCRGVGAGGAETATPRCRVITSAASGAAEAAGSSAQMLGATPLSDGDPSSPSVVADGNGGGGSWAISSSDASDGTLAARGLRRPSGTGTGNGSPSNCSPRSAAIACASFSCTRCCCVAASRASPCESEGTIDDRALSGATYSRADGAAPAAPAPDPAPAPAPEPAPAAGTRTSPPPASCRSDSSWDADATGAKLGCMLSLWLCFKLGTKPPRDTTRDCWPTPCMFGSSVMAKHSKPRWRRSDSTNAKSVRGSSRPAVGR